jgi:hypothetical protein
MPDSSVDTAVSSASSVAGVRLDLGGSMRLDLLLRVCAFRRSSPAALIMLRDDLTHFVLEHDWPAPTFW